MSPSRSTSSEQKRAEEAFRRVEEQARAIVDSALDAVIVMDAEGNITEWNKQAEETFGWTRPEALGRRMSEQSFQCNIVIRMKAVCEQFLQDRSRPGSEPANRNYGDSSRWHGVSGGAVDHAIENWRYLDI